MPNSPSPTNQHWDIFCRVIDNYGDIGVCWRLARQLADEYGLSVRLWLDDIAALRRIWPMAEDQEHQIVAGIELRYWPEVFTPTTPADVVIEAFACELPDVYVAAMKQQVPHPRWLNLEYLSAESWVDDCHGMQSIHPRNGLTKTFYFPGFSAKTGGLLRERSLTDARNQLQSSPEGRAVFLNGLGVKVTPNVLLISLFSYENPAIGSLIDSWRQSSMPVTCLVPEGKILPLITRHIGQSLQVGNIVHLDQLKIQVIPFLTQDQYDRLLWCCDVNFVRGEDSFVRAQWAAKPLIWHIYPQEEDAHLEKLAAFIDRYRQGLSPAMAKAVDALWQGWNRGEDCHHAWNLCMAGLSEWQIHSEHWEQTLKSLGDLAAKLVQFCEKPL
jgi:uncharacterized repeat protein (TIGR03837 family)